MAVFGDFARTCCGIRCRMYDVIFALQCFCFAGRAFLVRRKPATILKFFGVLAGGAAPNVIVHRTQAFFHAFTWQKMLIVIRFA